MGKNLNILGALLASEFAMTAAPVIGEISGTDFGKRAADAMMGRAYGQDNYVRNPLDIDAQYGTDIVGHIGGDPCSLWTVAGDPSRGDPLFIAFDSDGDNKSDKIEISLDGGRLWGDISSDFGLRGQGSFAPSYSSSNDQVVGMSDDYGEFKVVSGYGDSGTAENVVTYKGPSSFGNIDDRTGYVYASKDAGAEFEGYRFEAPDVGISVFDDSDGEEVDFQYDSLSNTAVYSDAKHDWEVVLVSDPFGNPVSRWTGVHGVPMDMGNGRLLVQEGDCSIHELVDTNIRPAEGTLSVESGNTELVLPDYGAVEVIPSTVSREMTYTIEDGVMTINMANGDVVLADLGDSYYVTGVLNTGASIMVDPHSDVAMGAGVSDDFDFNAFYTSRMECPLPPSSAVVVPEPTPGAFTFAQVSSNGSVDVDPCASGDYVTYPGVQPAITVVCDEGDTGGGETGDTDDTDTARDTGVSPDDTGVGDTAGLDTGDEQNDGVCGCALPNGKTPPSSMAILVAGIIAVLTGRSRKEGK
ncbi:MAG: hypothetical protein WC846_03140 [Candidatus Gracilibacteria bacterium]|jgi:hypothetical protein